jgi:hypothetical protein
VDDPGRKFQLFGKYTTPDIRKGRDIMGKIEKKVDSE